MAGKAIGELNGWRAKWLQIVVGILIPLFIAIIAPAVAWGINSLIRIDERMVSMSKRTSDIEEANKEQWKTMNKMQSETNELGAEHEKFREQLATHDREINRIRDRKDG